MPTLEAQEYERFRYDEPTLTLEEAVKKAAELRRKDPANFYRVENADDSRTAFTVAKVPVSTVYADFVARIARVLTRSKRRNRVR
jgi:phosphoenolpyruvate carboxylase